MRPSAGSLDVRRIAPRSCTGSSAKLLNRNKLQDCALRPSGRFVGSGRKAITVHEESVSYRRPILPYCKSIPHEQVQFRAILVATNPTRYHHLSRKVAKSRERSRKVAKGRDCKINKYITDVELFKFNCSNV